jgi:hypothetical protein
MATHRLQDTGCSPESAFQFTLDVLDTAEDLMAQRRPTTPKTLMPLLRARASGRRPTLPQLQAALSQVTRWREHMLTRDLLAHRRQLLTLRARTEAELNRLSEDFAYLTVMVRETDAVLRTSWRAPNDAECAAPPGPAADPLPET